MLKGCEPFTKGYRNGYHNVKPRNSVPKHAHYKHAAGYLAVDTFMESYPLNNRDLDQSAD